MAELASPAFVRVGLLSVGQGEWGTFSPAETISLLSRADHRRNIVRGDYAAAVQHCPDSVPGWRKQVVEWLQEVRGDHAGLLNPRNFATAVPYLFVPWCEVDFP